MQTPKLALAVHQTHAVDEEIRAVLTSLRRVRYLARRGQAWKAFSLATGPWFPIALGITDLPVASPESAAPAPVAAELKALEVLSEPVSRAPEPPKAIPGRGMMGGMGGGFF